MYTVVLSLPLAMASLSFSGTFACFGLFFSCLVLTWTCPWALVLALEKAGCCVAFPTCLVDLTVSLGLCRTNFVYFNTYTGQGESS
jgi:hypothetical protein